MRPRRELALGLAVVAVATLAALTARAVLVRGAWLRARLASPLAREIPGHAPVLRLANRGETLVVVSGTGAEVWTLDRDGVAPVHTFDWTGYQRALFAGEADLALVQPRREGELALVRLTTGELVGRFTWPLEGSAALSPSGALAAARVGAGVEVRTTRTGALVRTLPFAPGERILSDSTVSCACEFAPEEDRLLVRAYGAGSDTYVENATWSLEDGRLLGRVGGSIVGLTRSGDLFGWANGGPLAAWSPTGERPRSAAACPSDDLPNGGLLLRTFEPPFRIVSERCGRALLEGVPSHPALSSDGRRAAFRRDGSIEIWDLDP